ncbi:MAG: hypothetical protein QM767_28430 [Anaeromyxobacter sp.]
MELVEAQRQALAEIRALVAAFLAGELEAPEFIPRFGALFAPFDPPDWAARNLTEQDKADLDVFILVNGGGSESIAPAFRSAGSGRMAWIRTPTAG